MVFAKLNFTYHRIDMIRKKKQKYTDQMMNKE
jgi:hypothetical protein